MTKVVHLKVHVIICTKSHARKNWYVKRERGNNDYAAAGRRRVLTYHNGRLGKTKGRLYKRKCPAWKESNSTRRLWNKSGATRKWNKQETVF